MGWDVNLSLLVEKGEERKSLSPLSLFIVISLSLSLSLFLSPTYPVITCNFTFLHSSSFHSFVQCLTRRFKVEVFSFSLKLLILQTVSTLLELFVPPKTSRFSYKKCDVNNTPMMMMMMMIFLSSYCQD